jgi:hypothetical protein
MCGPPMMGAHHWLCATPPFFSLDVGHFEKGLIFVCKFTVVPADHMINNLAAAFTTLCGTAAIHFAGKL